MSANQGNFNGQQVNNVNANVNMPSQQAFAQWAQLSVQLSHFNVIIAIDNATFASWNHVDQQFILSSYMMATGGTVPTFFPNSNRVFLGPLALFQSHGMQIPTAAQFPQPAAQPVALQYNGAHLQGQPNAGGAQLLPIAGGAQLHAFAAGAQPQAIAAGAQVPAMATGVANPAPRSGRARAKTNAGQPPRPRNPWILYRQHHHEAFHIAHPEYTNTQLSKFISTQWNNEPQGVKDIWYRLAREEKAEHQRKYPNYKFSPRKPSEKKRRSTNKKAPTLQLVPANQSAEQTAFEAALAAAPPSPFAVVHRHGSNFDVTVTPAVYNYTAGEGGLDLAAEAKIFYQNMMNGANEMHLEAAELINAFDNAQGGEVQVGEAQVDEAQAENPQVGEDVPFFQLEDGAFPELDGDDLFDAFFK